MSVTTETELDALLDAILARARQRPTPPLVNDDGDVVEPRAGGGGRLTVNSGDTILASWGNMVFDQTVINFANAAARDSQWPAPNSGSVCYTVDTNTVWARIAGVWLPWLGPGRAPVTGGLVWQNDAYGDVWVAKGGVNAGNWRRARDVLQARWYRAAAFTVAGYAQIALDTASRDPYGLFTSGGFVAPVAGVYAVKAAVGATTTVAGQYLIAAIYQNGTARALIHHYGSGNPQYWDVPIADDVACAQGDTVQLWAAASTSAGGSATSSETYMSIRYVGTG